MLVMAFRNHKFRSPRPVPSQVFEEVVKETPRNGVVFCEVVTQPVDSSMLPAYSDYQLSRLLAAGVPLQQINVEHMLDCSPSSAELSNVEKMLDNDLSSDSESSNVEPNK